MVLVLCGGGVGFVWFGVVLVLVWCGVCVGVVCVCVGVVCVGVGFVWCWCWCWFPGLVLVLCGVGVVWFWLRLGNKVARLAPLAAAALLLDCTKNYRRDPRPEVFRFRVQGSRFRI